MDIFLSLMKLKVIGILNSYYSLREFIPEWFNSEIQATVVTRNHLHRKATLKNNA